MSSLPTKVLLCFWLCLGVTANAQYRIEQWTADDGLPQNSVYSIVQTSDGYLWLATADGLARFDGARFTIFNKSNSPGITNNRFTALFEDAQGDLWAGTEEGGMVRYHKGRFSSVRGGAGRIDWIDGGMDGDGVTFLSELKAFRLSDGTFSAFAFPTSFSNPPHVVRPKSVKVYCTLDFGCYANGQHFRVSPGQGLPEYKFRSAAQGADGTLWLLTHRDELVRIDSGEVVHVTNQPVGPPKDPLDFIPGANVTLLSRDAQNSLWLTDLATMRHERLLHTLDGAPPESGDIYPPYALGESAFYTSYQDDEGNLWFGTPRGGLYRARKQVVTTFSTAEGLTDNNVCPLYEDDDGALLVGTTSGAFNLRNGHFAPVESPHKSAVHAFGRDPAGRIVFSNYGNLYVRAANRSVPFLRGTIPAERAIHAIHSDRDDALWIGAEDGLMRFKDAALTRFTTANGLAGNDVKVIIDAQAGGLWIGTYGGLSRYHDGELTSWTEENGLPSRTIRALHEDVDGALWIGSYDGGLARFKDGQFTHYNSSIGLHNDGAFQILEDGRRNFWISSNRGIYRVNKDELNSFADGTRDTITSVAYAKSDGMLNAEANGGCSPGGVRTRDGRLWFPTQNGVAMIDPEGIRINSQPPPVVIESVSINHRSSELPDTGGESHLTIESSQDNFAITYTALSFINSANLRFKYKLEGLDDDWIDAGTRRLAYFSHVPPGRYTFRVIAANSDDVWNEQGATLSIAVLPPFYRTWWFLTGAAFAIGAAAFLMFHRRVTQIRLKYAQELAFSRRLIDSQEQERKRFAAEMHDGLGQSLVIIKNRARLSLKQPDRAEAMIDHLEHISATASHAIHEAKEIAFNLRPHLLDRLGLTKTIESMLDKVFGASGIEFETRIDVIDDVLDKDSEIVLYRIVQECANNIVKHSQAQKAWLSIERDGSNLTVKISDNGRGFDPAASDHDLSKRSFGLVGIAERTRLLGGTLHIESTPGGGTRMVITAPSGARAGTS